MPTLGLDKIVEFLLGLIDKLLPIFILHPYERAIQYWCGKYLRTVGNTGRGGLFWKVPFLDSYDKATVVTTTLTIPTQSLTTKDGKQIVVKCVVKYNIYDVRSFLLKITDAVDAIMDVAQCTIKEQITQRTWDECADNELDNLLTKKLRNAVRKWGVDIEQVTLTDLGLIRSFRFFNETVQVYNN